MVPPYRSHQPRYRPSLRGGFLILALELEKRAALSDFDLGAIFRDGIDRWQYFLSRGESLDLDSPELLGADADIREALEIMSVFTKQDRARHTYERRLDYERTIIGGLEASRAEGLAEGIAAGIEKGISEGEHKRALEDARRFKALGVSTDVIAEGTGLAKDEIEEL